MNRTRLIALAALLTIAGGCSKGADGGDEGGGNNTAVPATVPEAVNESLVQDPQNHAVPLDLPPSPARR